MGTPAKTEGASIMIWGRKFRTDKDGVVALGPDFLEKLANLIRENTEPIEASPEQPLRIYVERHPPVPCYNC